MAEVKRLFSTPVAIETLGDTVDLAALKSAILAERERDPSGIAVSNIGGWHSAMDFQHRGGDAARELAVRAATLADAMTFDAGKPAARNHRWNVDMWANVATNGDSQQLHYHPGSVWSAVAYVDDGFDGDSNAELGGLLTLLDPRMPMIRMNAPHLRLRDGDGTEQAIDASVRPQTGMIVAFPAWLGHAFTTFRGKGTRISVALNLRMA